VYANAFSAPHLFLRDGARNVDPAFSPDGTLIAYSSYETGESQVYVRRFPPGAERWRVTSDGGGGSVWNGSGTELFYRAADDSLMVVPVSTAPAVEIGRPRPAIDAAASGAVTSRGFDISRDGRRVLVVRRSDAGHNMHLVVVEGWLAEFVNR
jgi:serine/threonine-protein kinase